MINKSRLLILSCSQKKKETSNLLPALNRYDGPAFQITRKYLNADPKANLSVYVLSAEYGLISSDTLIPSYDRKLTLKRADELKPTIEKEIISITKSANYHEGLICLGKLYQHAAGDALTSLQSNRQIKLVDGSIGRQNSILYHWLFQALPPLEEPIPADAQKPIVFKGKEITTTKEELIKLALNELKCNPQAASRFETWYVTIGKYKVAPKWLFSLLSGLPVSQFRTADARRVLTALCIEVKRINV